jgi:tRNA pseudouridine55 synthase
MLTGILNIYKEIGFTSHDVVAKVRRILHEKRVGHAGTLDPAAEGVLPVCVGQATRVVEYLSDARKTYCADVILGITTDTYDREGVVTSLAEVPHLSTADLEAVLENFRGPLQQIPPLYSAIKVAGKPLHKIARSGRGDEVELKPRPVEIFTLKLNLWEYPWLRLWVECSKGTYIRSLAHDLGQALGCGAYLHHLVRVESGPFHLKDAITLARLEELEQEKRLEEVLEHADRVLSDWPALIANPHTAEKIKQGRNLPLEETLTLPDWAVNRAASNPDIPYRRLYTAEGDLLALLAREGQEWHPSKVFL